MTTMATDRCSPPLVANLLHTISAHTSDVNFVAFSPDALVTVSADKTIRLWNHKTDYSELPYSPICGHTYCIYCCQFSPYGKYLATCSMDGACIIWDPHTGEKLCTVKHKSSTSIRVCQFSPNSDLFVTGSDDNTLCIWEVQTGKLVKTFEGHDESVVACSFSPDGNYIISGSPNGDVRLWDARYGRAKQLTFELDCHDLGVTSCDFSSQYMYCASENKLITLAHYLLATGGKDHNVKLWEIQAELGSETVSLKVTDTLSGHTCMVLCVTFSANAKLLASSSGDKTVRLWDPAKGQCVHVIEGHTRYVTCCAFSPDGTKLASGSNDKKVCVWGIMPETELADDSTCDNLIQLFDEAAAQIHNQVEKWSVEEVTQWLNQIGMGQPQFLASFKANAIDGTELITLNHKTLERDLGVAALGHRNKILRAIASIQEHPFIQGKANDTCFPDEFLCPITREVMKDPVIAADGYTYEKAAIEMWVKSSKYRSPLTNAPLNNFLLTPNRSLKMIIQRYIQDQT